MIVRASALRTLRHVRTHNFRCCLNCLYPLHDDRPDAVCPECGTPVYLPIVELRWRTCIDTLCPRSPPSPPAFTNIEPAAGPPDRA